VSDIPVSVTIENRGNSPSGPSSLLFELVPGSPRTVPIPSIPPYSSTSVQTTYLSLPEGDYDLRVIVDSGNSVAESDETNNVLTDVIMIG